MIIRDEQPKDIPAIFTITTNAFAPMPFSSGTEPGIIDALRSEGDLTLSLVALIDDNVVGQITFSPVTINGQHKDYFGLGPVSVAPDHQSKGIGAALINEGLERLKALDAKGCVLVGNPDYYSRFGFKNDETLDYHGLDMKFVQRLTFRGKQDNGALLFAPAFEKAENA